VVLNDKASDSYSEARIKMAWHRDQRRTKMCVCGKIAANSRIDAKNGSHKKLKTVCGDALYFV